MNAVSLRTAPPRSSASKPKEAKAAKPAKAEEPAPDDRSAMQKLLDKFK
jgi:PTH1 family peptidyl-tRNA hydrolase